jgi:hypothetical protein
MKRRLPRIVTATYTARDHVLIKLLLAASLFLGVLHRPEGKALKKDFAHIEHAITALRSHAPAGLTRLQSRIRVLSSVSQSSWAHPAVRTSFGPDPAATPLVHPDVLSALAAPAFTGCGRAPPFFLI